MGSFTFTRRGTVQLIPSELDAPPLPFASAAAAALLALGGAI